MKKFLLASLVAFTYAIYSLHQRGAGATAVVALKPPTATLAPAETPAATPAPDSTTPAVATPAGAYKDGQFTGSVADAYYGNVQIKVTISGGKLTTVDFLQYPKDRATSERINTQAIPYLQQEAITAQSAKIDGVSGATYTSQAFVESLSAALSSAHA
jgi:uncharacterized protein with FMN-binding domain